MKRIKRGCTKCSTTLNSWKAGEGIFSLVHSMLQVQPLAQLYIRIRPDTPGHARSLEHLFLSYAIKRLVGIKRSFNLI